MSRERARTPARGGGAPGPAVAGGAVRRHRFGVRTVAAALALATSLTFWGVVSNGWIELDDRDYILNNPHVNTGLSAENLVWFLHTPHGGNWHPLTSMSHMADVQLFGLDPGAHHAVSLALHVANVALLFYVLFQLTGGLWRSALVALLWGVHPLRVESVAWAAERKDVLSMLFLLLTIEAYRRWVSRPTRIRYAAVLASLALGLMSKPMLVSTPLLLLLLDVWPLGRLEGLPRDIAPHPACRTLARRTPLALVVEKWPLVLLAAASSAATLWAQSASHAVITTTVLSPLERAANAVVSLWRYVGKTLWPVDLIPFYPRAGLEPSAAAACALGVLIVVWLGWSYRRRWPALPVGLGWYGITLLPVIGLLQVGGQAYADRYTYLPVIGLLIAAGWAPWRGRPAQAAAVAAVLAATILGGLTHRQVSRWKDSRTLFEYTLRVSPNNGVAHNCLGLALYRDGDQDGARKAFEAAIASDPGVLDPYTNLCELLNHAGRHEEALRYCGMATRIRPDARGLAQVALANLGTGRIDTAAGLYRRALEMNPNDVVALRYYAVVLRMQGHPDRTLPLLRRAEHLDPDDPVTQFVLGKALYVEGHGTEEAIERMRRAMALKPDWAEPMHTLARILATAPDTSVRRPAEAVELASRARVLTDGRDPEVLQSLAAALAAAGRYGAAAEAARSALDIVKRTGPDSLVADLEGRLRGYESAVRGD